jgi:cobalt-zinc-cadmium efflux system outer membrane protein
LLVKPSLSLAFLSAVALASWSGSSWADEPGRPGRPLEPASTAAFDDVAQAGLPPDLPIPSPLSLDEALRILDARGLDLLAAEAAIRTAEGNAQTAAAVANPQISASDGPTLNYEANGPGCSGCSRQNLSVAVGDNAAILDALVGKRGLRLEVARAALAAARLARADARRNLAFQVKQAYAAVVLAADALDLAREIAKSLEQTFAVSRAQYPRALDEGGLARIEVQKLEGDQAVSGAVMALRQAKVTLAFLLGSRRMASDFDVDRDTLKYKVPAALSGATAASLLRRALGLRPDVAVLGYQRLRADAGLRLAQRRQMPDVQISINYNSLGLGQGGASPPYVAPQLQANLPVFYQQQGEVRRARADLTTQALQHAKALARVASDVEMAFAAFEANRNLVERMEATLLGRARTARDIVEKQYRGGNLKLSDFLDSQRTYIATNLEYLQDRAAYWTAVYQLEQAVGAELRR